MVDKVLNAITTALYAKFGEGYKFYVENVEQNLAPPCFTVDVLNPIERSVNSSTYYRTIPCVIHYFTNNRTTPKADCYSVGESALEALEYITVEDRPIRGEDMEYSMVDDVLEIFITYRFWTENVQQNDDMDSVDYGTTVVN